MGNIVVVSPVAPRAGARPCGANWPAVDRASSASAAPQASLVHDERAGAAVDGAPADAHACVLGLVLG